MGGQPCHGFSGDFTVYVERVAAEPTLIREVESGNMLPDGVSLMPGAAVRVIIGSNPETKESYRVPRTGRDWTFVPDSGPALSYPSAKDSLWFVPPSTGTLHVTGDANGFLQQFAERIVVGPAADLAVTASDSAVLEGDTVTFLVTERNGYAVAGITSQWVPDSLPGGTVSSPGCGVTCTAAIRESGWLKVTAYLASAPWVSVRDSVRVEALCWYPDPVLNLPAVRTALRAAMDSSNANDADRSKRQERIFQVNTETSDSTTLVTWPTMTLSTPCEGAAPIISTAGQPLVAWFHTHPFQPATATKVAERTPNNCRPAARNIVYRARPSDDDYISAGAISSPAKSYFVDKEYVTEFEGQHPWAANPNLRHSLPLVHHPMRKRGCRM